MYQTHRQSLVEAILTQTALHWLATTATLVKELAKDKLANIRLRAVPVEVN